VRRLNCDDISLTVAYQNPKTTAYHLVVCSFSLTSITDIMSSFRRQQIFFPLFLLAAEK